MCCFTSFGDYLETYLLFFIGILLCYVSIGFCNRFIHGGEYVGVVFPKRAPRYTMDLPRKTNDERISRTESLQDAILVVATSQSWVAPAFPTELEWEDMRFEIWKRRVLEMLLETNFRMIRWWILASYDSLHNMFRMICVYVSNIWVNVQDNVHEYFPY